MGIQSTAFSSELVKIAAGKEKKHSYPRAMVAMAPVAAVSAAADFPRGWVDKAVENRVTRTPGKVSKSPMGRAIGRATGRLGAGLITTPMFFSGIKDLKEAKNKDQYNKGLAKVIGSGAAYSAMKGGTESGIEHGLTKGLIGRAKSVAGVRGVLGAAAAAGTAASIAKTLRGPESESKAFMNRVVMPIAAGAAIGALKGGAEYSWVERKGLLKKLKAPRGIIGATAGRAAAGALGALAISEVARWALEKTSEEKAVPGSYRPVNLGPKPGELYSQVGGWARKSDTKRVMHQYQSTVKRGDPEATPTRRAVYYALHDELKNRKAPNLTAPKMRDQVHKPTKAPAVIETAAFAAITLAPEMAWNLGIIPMKATQKDKVLQDALDRMIASNGIAKVEADLDFWGNPQNMFYETEAASKWVNPSGEVMTFKNQQKVIALGKNTAPEVAAHELGHATATGIRRSIFQSPKAQLAYRFAKPAMIALPLLALDSANDKSFATPAEIEARAKFSENVGKVGLVIMSPVLAEEAIASAKGTQYLAQVAKKAKYKNPLAFSISRGIRTLLPAFATYAAPAALPFLIASHLRRKAKKAEGRPK